MRCPFLLVLGCTAVDAFMDQYAKIVYQPKMELLASVLHQTVQAITRKMNVAEKDIYVLGFADMNMPHAKLKERVEQWAVGSQTLTERCEEIWAIPAEPKSERINTLPFSHTAGKQHKISSRIFVRLPAGRRVS